MQSPEAIFDVSSIVARHRQADGSVGRINIQRTAYLACLLSLYDGQPISDWGYRFSKTGFGTPFSAEVNNAIDSMNSHGWIASTTHGEEGAVRFTLSETGAAFLVSITQMRNLQGRLRYLDAAFDSALIASPSTLSEGIDNEPTVQRALKGERGKSLLEGPALQLLHQQFKALTEIVGPGLDDLITPSVVWLSYIAGESPTRRDPEAVPNA